MERPLLSKQPIIGVFSWRPRATLTLLMSYFGLFGAIVGAQGVLWAEVVAALRLSKAVFGSVQLVAPLLSVGLLLAGGQLTSWAGKKRLALAALMLLAASLLALARAVELWGLVCALLLAGAGMAMLEVAMNGATLDWERATGRNVMNLMHAGFSGGAVVGAMGAGSLLGPGWSYGQILALLVLTCVLMIVATFPVSYPPVEASRTEVSGPAATLRLLVGRRALLVLALVCVLGIVGESISNLWSVIYLRDLGARAFVGGAAFALFNGAMFAGRLLNTQLVNRRGSRISLLVSGAGIVLSALLLLVPENVPVVVAAFMLLGLSVAGVVPTVLSAAARLSPGNSGAIAGGIMAVAYSGFIICPPLTGWIADLSSLQVALVSVGLSGLGILWLARGVK